VRLSKSGDRPAPPEVKRQWRGVQEVFDNWGFIINGVLGVLFYSDKLGLTRIEPYFDDWGVIRIVELSLGWRRVPSFGAQRGARGRLGGGEFLPGRAGG
jgi:hypothetical protein